MSAEIKFCGFTNEDDLRAAVALPIQYIGFNFAKGPRKIDAERARVLTALIPLQVKRVGLFVDNERAYMHDCLVAGKCDYVQLHGNEDEDEIRYWQESYKVIKAFRVRDQRTLEAAQNSPADMVLLDAYVPGSEGGTGASWDYTLLQSWTSLKPFMLAGGLNPDTVANAITACKPWAVDCASGVESAPACKDPQKMQAFVETVRSIDL